MLLQDGGIVPLPYNLEGEFLYLLEFVGDLVVGLGMILGWSILEGDILTGDVSDLKRCITVDPFEPYTLGTVDFQTHEIKYKRKECHLADTK